MLTLRAEPAKEHWACRRGLAASISKACGGQRCEVWLRGERVKDVTIQPGLAGGVRDLSTAAINRSTDL